MSAESLRKKIDTAKECLKEAILSLDSISKNDRDADTDRTVREAADLIYEAQEKLESLDSGIHSYVSENIVMRRMRPRIKKQ